MQNQLKPPIILFGNTRSGTTILQKLLAIHPDVEQWYEPNALWLYADPGRNHDEFDETDASDAVKSYIRDRFLKYQQRHGNLTVMEKTPQNILRIPYVRAIFPEATFLFIVRNPFSFISSVEYKWQKPVTGRGVIRRLKDMPLSQLPYWMRRYFGQFINKRILRRKYLPIWGSRYKGIQDDIKSHDFLTIVARQWSVCSMRAEQAMSHLADGEILRLRYEDFIEQPTSYLERICDHCGLDMTRDMYNTAQQVVKRDRNQKWKRFNPNELARILPEIEGEMRRHGYEVPQEITQVLRVPNAKTVSEVLG